MSEPLEDSDSIPFSDRITRRDIRSMSSDEWFD
jgi:hypothetical protein